MPTWEDLEDGLNVLLEETGFDTGLEDLSKDQLIDLVLKMNHAARLREQWLVDLLRSLGPEVAGLIPVNEAVTVHSVAKAVRTLRTQRDEARVQATKLTGKELGTLNDADRILDTCFILRRLLQKYRSGAEDVGKVDAAVAAVEGLLGTIKQEPDTFRAQKKRVPRAKHIGDQDFKRMPENPSDTFARDTPLVQVPDPADLETFLKGLQEANTEAKIKTGFPDSSEPFQFDEKGDLKMIGTADEALKRRIQASLDPNTGRYGLMPDLPDYGSNFSSRYTRWPGEFIQGLDPAIPGTDRTVVIPIDWAELETTVASSDVGEQFSVDLQTVTALAGAIKAAKPAAPMDAFLALAAGGDDPKVAYSLSGPPSLPLDASDTIPTGIVPMMANRPLTAGELVTVHDVAPIPQSGQIEMKVIKEREKKEGDPEIELAWDGFKESDEVEPEGEEKDEEQLF